MALTVARPGPGLSITLRSAPGTLLALTGCSILTGTTAAAAVVAVKLFVDGVVGGLAPGQLAGAAGLFVGSTLVASTTPEVMAYLTAQCGRAAQLEATARLYQKVGAEPGIERLERPSYQDSVQLATEASDAAPAQLVAAGLGCVQSAVSVATLCWVMAASQPLVAAVAAAGSMPVIVVETWLARRRIRLRSQLVPIERRRQAYRSLIMDPVAGKEIRLFALTDFFGCRMLADLRAANRAERNVDRISLVAGLGLACAQVTLTGVVIAIAVRGATGRTLTAGDVTALIAAFGSLTGGLAGLVGELAHLREALSLLRIYGQALDGDPTRPVCSEPVPPLAEQITLQDVWFRYDDDLPWVLRGVDLTIRAGESLALVGSNGTGKSTLVKLLCGLYQPTKGRILWDGVDLATADVVSLRSRIGTVFQDYMTYDLTAHENIAVGALERLDDPDAVRVAAKSAGIAADLEALPRGYDTMLSRLLYRDPTDPDDLDPRVVLSGGQWQRLALARMLMRGDRDLLILDEPSAGLDAVAEHRVHRSIQETMRGRARLLISHRLSAVRMADRIAVLTDGRIVECGDHASLLVNDGGYAKLFRLQASGYVSEPEPNDREG